MSAKKSIDLNSLPDLVFEQSQDNDLTQPSLAASPIARRISFRLLKMHIDTFNGHKNFDSEDFASAVEDEAGFSRILNLLRDAKSVISDEKLCARINAVIDSIEKK